MPILTINGILIIILLGILAAYSLREHRWWLLPIDLAGVVAAGLAVGMELGHFENRILTIATMAAITLVLIVNIWFVFRDLRSGEMGDLLDNGLPRRGALYRMIADEDELREEVNSRQEEEISEGLQALELWKVGNESYVDGNYLDALSKYELSLRWVPSVPAAVNASAAALELQKFEEAERYAATALEIRDDCVEAWVNRGLALERLQRPEEALQAYEKALELAPQDVVVHLLAGRVLRRLGQLDRAVEVLDRGLEIAPDHSELLFEKSLALIRQGRREDALPFLTETVKRNPKHYLAFFHLANTLNRLDRNEEAVHYYDLVLKLKPDHTEAWNNRGIALSKMRRLRKAIQSYKKALALRPQYHEAWINLALAHDSLGQANEALRAYKQFLDLAPSSMTKHIELTRRRVQELEQQIQRRKARKKAETAQERTEDEGSGEPIVVGAPPEQKKVDEKAADVVE